MSHSDQFGVWVAPAELHFNAAHFITLGDTCENLHGHNFHVRLEADGANTEDALVVDFVALSRAAAKICAGLHDRVLLAAESPIVELQKDAGMVHVHCLGRRFSLPEDSCRLLPVSNTTAEMLAQHILNELLEVLAPSGALAGVAELRVAVEEADRQWGLCRRAL